MSILRNAVISIQLGVEDYGSDDRRRQHSAVRNIYAGLLLLYKEKLRQLSPKDNPELFLKRKIRPAFGKDGHITWKAAADQTVDAADIKERFKELKISVDWTTFDRIRKLRNDLEHYYTKESPDTIIEILAKSFQLIQMFLVQELNEEPKKLLGDTCWQSLLGIEEVYEAAKQDCMKTLYSLDWRYAVVRKSLPSLECPDCNSELIRFCGGDAAYPDIDLVCHSCACKFVYVDVISEHLDKIYFAENYLAGTQGGEYAVDECPSCGVGAYIVEDNVCVHCDFKYVYQQCSRCGCELGAVGPDASESDGAPKCDQCDYADYLMETSG